MLLLRITKYDTRWYRTTTKFWRPPQSSYQRSLHNQRWNFLNTTSLMPKEVCLVCCMTLHFIGQLRSTQFFCKGLRRCWYLQSTIFYVESIWWVHWGKSLSRATNGDKLDQSSTRQCYCEDGRYTQCLHRLYFSKT